jgi:hypothetical protein
VERARAALRPPAVVRLTFLPPIARVDSRLPRAPTCDLPSRSCWPVSPFVSLCLLLDRLRLFSALLAYFDAPDSLSAMEKLSYSVPSESAALCRAWSCATKRLPISTACARVYLVIPLLYHKRSGDRSRR